MKYLVVGAMALAVFAAAPASAESMQITPNGSRSSAKGPSQYFTESVTVDPLYAANESTSSSGGLVAFEPGARSAWHTHPGGQFLIVTSGTGWVQEEGGQKREIKPGGRDLDPAGREALAWSNGSQCHESHRHHERRWREERRLDGEGRRRPVPELLALPAKRG